MYMCAQRLPLFLGSHCMLGQAGHSVSDPSIWRLPEATHMVCVFKAKPPCNDCSGTIHNKLPYHNYLTPFITQVTPSCSFHCDIECALSGQVENSSYFHPPSCIVFLSHSGKATKCSSPHPHARCRLQALCGVVSAWPRL